MFCHAALGTQRQPFISSDDYKSLSISKVEPFTASSPRSAGHGEEIRGKAAEQSKLGLNSAPKAEPPAGHSCRHPHNASLPLSSEFY